MTDEMTVQTKSSVTPMVVGGVLGAGAGAGATFIPKIKEYISESPKYKEFDDIVKETSNNDKFEKIMDEAGLNDAKKSEIKEKIKTVNETNSQTVEGVKKTVDEAKNAVAKAINDVNKDVKKELINELRTTRKKGTMESFLTDTEKRQLKLKKFIEQNIDKDANLSDDVKKFIEKLRNAGSDETKIAAVKDEFKELYNEYESISLKSLDPKSQTYLKKLRTANKSKEEGSALKNNIDALKSAKTKLEEAVKAEEDSIKNALEPYKDDFAKLFERGKKSWGKVTAIIAGGLVVGSIIGSFFRSKNNDIA